ncbi:MAG: LPS assembly lipoprotein LptE [Kiloniellales bacterium]
MVALAALLSLAACGFEPLYGSQEDGGETTAQMAEVRIAPLPDRIGQSMHNLLRDRINPRGQPAKAGYLLNVKLTEAVQATALRADETATRANLTVYADYELRDSDGKAVLAHGRISSTDSYDILESYYATIVSQEDARERALRELSDTIRNRLALYFSGA